jgi:hypothetical protein
MLTGSHFLLAMAFALREGQHIRIDISAGISQRTRAMIDLAGYTVLLPSPSGSPRADAALLDRLRELREERAVGAQHAGLPFRVVHRRLVLLALQVAVEIKLVRLVRPGPRPDAPATREPRMEYLPF